MKKTLFTLLLASAIFAGCSKNKCEGCTAKVSVYLDGVLQYTSSHAVDCGAMPGSKVKRVPSGGKTFTEITTITCN